MKSILTLRIDRDLWIEFVKSKDYFRSAQIFDEEGKPITLKKAEKLYFCHTRILFKGVPEGELKVLAHFLNYIASTPSEHMSVDIRNFYGFQEVIIS